MAPPKDPDVAALAEMPEVKVEQVGVLAMFALLACAEAFISRRQQLKGKQEKHESNGGPGRGRSAARGRGGRGRGYGRSGKAKAAPLDEECEPEEDSEGEGEPQNEQENVEADGDGEKPKVPMKRKRSKQQPNPCEEPEATVPSKSRAKRPKVAEQANAPKKERQYVTRACKPKARPKASSAPRPQPVWPGFAAMGIEPPAEGVACPHAVKAIRDFVDATDWGLELDGLKRNIRCRLPQGCTQCSLTIYWTRYSCGVRLKDPWGTWRNVGYFSFTRNTLNPYVRLVVAVSAALQMAPCLACGKNDVRNQTVKFLSQVKVLAEYTEPLPDPVMATGENFLKFQAGVAIEELEAAEAARRSAQGPNDVMDLD